MDEYIKRSDMRAVLEKASINPRFADEPPAADVEPVVRCKDCSHCYHGELCLACLFWHRMTNPNFYCQYGQKMDGEV